MKELGKEGLGPVSLVTNGEPTRRNDAIVIFKGRDSQFFHWSHEWDEDA